MKFDWLQFIMSEKRHDKILDFENKQQSVIHWTNNNPVQPCMQQ